MPMRRHKFLSGHRRYHPNTRCHFISAQTTMKGKGGTF